MLQKCCNQKKTQWNIGRNGHLTPQNYAKIPTKTHEMDVLEALENETLESHSISRGSSATRSASTKTSLSARFVLMGRVTIFVFFRQVK